MNRSETRILVRKVAQSQSPMAALALFERSMEHGHTRIALLRYMDARDLSAPLAEKHHDYARLVVTQMSDREVEAVARQALERSKKRRASESG